ncbi:MAG: hypothetical protein QOG49_1302, partial [Frankiaceae bacterium]|nr:hypothetical protein [Frankiaceae bacterium]
MTSFGVRAGRIASVLALVLAGVAAAPAGASAAATAKPAIFHNGVWSLRQSLTSGPANISLLYGRSGDLPVMGDWNGDGNDTVGIARFPAGSTGM